MPQIVPISAIPNQQFTISLDNNLFNIGIRYASGVMTISLIINGVDTIDNLMLVAGSLVIPAAYQEAGNFILQTASDQLPNYTQFNVTQSLIYFTAAELASYRTPSALPYTAATFNPDGALPLRFQPKGYH